jgi:hypothetical protein
MNFRCKLKINWWLWASISIPFFFLNWMRQRDIKGETMSDWTYLISYLKKMNFKPNHDILSFFAESMCWNVGVPLVIGWVVQYVLVLAWHRIRGSTETRK